MNHFLAYDVSPVLSSRSHVLIFPLRNLLELLSGHARQALRQIIRLHSALEPAWATKAVSYSQMSFNNQFLSLPEFIVFHAIENLYSGIQVPPGSYKATRDFDHGTSPAQHTFVSF